MAATRVAVGIVTCAFITASAYGGVVILDFEQFGATSTSGYHPGAFTSLVCGSEEVTMTITRSSGEGFDIMNCTVKPFPGTWGYRALDPFHNAALDDWFVANFSAPVTFVALQMVDFGGDSDTVHLEAYSAANGGGNLVGAQSVFWGLGSGPSYASASVVALGDDQIRSVRFRGNYSAWPNSMYVDNIEVQTPIIPEPATLGLLGLGLVGLAARRKR